MSAHKKTDARPVRLRGDTLTPPARTPWGGHRIRALKGLPPGPPVGESWELSVEPSFPCRTEDGTPLAELIAGAPGAWLGRDDVSGTPLLVKLLDAEAPLSVQIHPDDDAPSLASDESGKPEAWYVVDAAPGAGLYIGWERAVDAERVRAAVTGGRDLSELLHFVPVAPGDYFVIEAGTPHCIGPGVLLVEPQRVQPGRYGVTYRYWDWDRRYDADGRLDPAGEPRRLDLDRALAVTRWDLPRGRALLDRIRHRAGPPVGAVGALELRVPAASTPLRTVRLTGNGALDLPLVGELRALTVLAGSVTVGSASLRPGQTAALPASYAGPALLEGAHATLCACLLAPPDG